MANLNSYSLQPSAAAFGTTVESLCNVMRAPLLYYSRLNRKIEHCWYRQQPLHVLPLAKAGGRGYPENGYFGLRKEPNISNGLKTFVRVFKV